MLTSFNLSMHFCPLGSLATETSGLSSGGGGCDAQLYSRFSSGTPIRSYCPACCLKNVGQTKTFSTRSKKLFVEQLTSSTRSNQGKQLQNLRFLKGALHPIYDLLRKGIL